MQFFKKQKSSIILIASMLIGLLIGLIFKEKAQYLEPLGNLFINLLSTIIVPLIFVTITLAICKIKPKKAFKLIRKITIVFIIMSLISVLVGVVATYLFPLVSSSNTITLNVNETIEANNNYLERFISMFSVSDFVSLFSKDNIIALMIFSIITGVAINMTHDKKECFIDILEKANSILMNIIKIIMYYAPIGICAFFASMVGTLGASIAFDYLRVFIYYSIISIIFAITIYSLIALGCKKKLKTFWLESIPIILCSLGTCSSAACLPINIKTVQKLGVTKETGDATISLGTSFHKDGSIIDSVFKIMFLVYLFNSPVSLLQVIGVALLASLLISAVPVGGGTISEMLIISLLGFPVTALPILTIIATITDAPATMLNSLGDTAASIWVDSLMKNDAIW